MAVVPKAEAALAAVLVLSAACSDYDLGSGDDEGIPPGDDDASGDDDDGGNPDFDGIPWDDCEQGYLGDYYNLPADHPDVEIDVGGVEPGSLPGSHDWWNPAWWVWSQYDPHLEFGTDWWPVDQGLPGDPQYFAVHWSAWIVVHEAAPFTFEMGSDDDSWLVIDGQVEADLGGIHGLAATEYEAVLDEGWYAFDIYFAERHTSESGFYFRFTGGPVTIYPSDCEDHP